MSEKVLIHGLETPSTYLQRKWSVISIDDPLGLPQSGMP